MACPNYKKWLQKYPSIEDLKPKAKSRIPHVAWEYLESGTGNDVAINRNRTDLDAVHLTPQFMKGEIKVDTKTTLFGQTYDAPFGMAPVGLTGLIWPNAEIICAQSAVRNNIPFSLSTVATKTPENLKNQIGNNGWFQLYPPRDLNIRNDLLSRVKESGFKVLLVTADVPVPAKRERTIRAGLQTPPKITPQFIWQGITNPAWSLATVKNGLPTLKTIESYSDKITLKAVEETVRFAFRGNLDWEYIKQVRDIWEGPLVLKGILHPEDAQKAVEIGCDGIVVSNHGGRQFNGAPSSISVLENIAQTIDNQINIIFDSGVRSGLDVAKALALGADFVLMGRSFLYGVAALGNYGADYVNDLVLEELKNNMIQLGFENIEQLKKYSETR